MHVGNYIKEIIDRKRYNYREVGDLINKSSEGVKKDIQKEKLQMAVLETYSNVFEVNIYQMLADAWNEEHNISTPEVAKAGEQERPTYGKRQAEKSDDELSVTIKVEGNRKDEILQILFDRYEKK